MNKESKLVDICYVISHGFAARMILHSKVFVDGFLDRSIEVIDGDRLTIDSPSPSSEVVKLAPDLLAAASRVVELQGESRIGFRGFLAPRLPSRIRHDVAFLA